MVMVARERAVSSIALWGALLSGPVAWLLDEGIALLIEATTCSGAHPAAVSVRVGLVAVGFAALACIGGGALVATRLLQAMNGGEAQASIRLERSRFLAMAALLLGGVSAFGVLLRLVTAFMGEVCS